MSDSRVSREERERLRRLDAAILPAPWCVLANERGDLEMCAVLGDLANEIPVNLSDRQVLEALVTARTLAPALLDALDVVERERDEAVGRLRNAGVHHSIGIVNPGGPGAEWGDCEVCGERWPCSASRLSDGGQS